MRLTSSDRDAFVAAAMDDVPKIDYSEQAKRLILAHMKTTVPTDLLAMIEKYPDRFVAHKVCMPLHLEDFYTKLTHKYVSWGDAVADDAMRKRIGEIDELSRAQTNTHRQLEAKLRAVISECTTLKQAKERMPEFEKYLPEDRDGKVCRQMPVIANLVEDLMAAGWPKDKPKGEGEPA